MTLNVLKEKIKMIEATNKYIVNGQNNFAVNY